MIMINILKDYFDRFLVKFSFDGVKIQFYAIIKNFSIRVIVINFKDQW